MRNNYNNTSLITSKWKLSLWEKPQTIKNKKHQPAKRWNEAMIQRQAEKMYTQVVEDLYNKLHTKVKANRFTPAEKWIKFINGNEVLDGLEESMIELEFE